LTTHDALLHEWTAVSAIGTLLTVPTVLAAAQCRLSHARWRRWLVAFTTGLSTVLLELWTYLAELGVLCDVALTSMYVDILAACATRPFLFLLVLILILGWCWRWDWCWIARLRAAFEYIALPLRVVAVLLLDGPCTGIPLPSRLRAEALVGCLGSGCG